ncbi:MULTISPECIES: DUF7882 family protein [unclassified Agreia]|uniref:DUF7882 family protein n=1 Tax=unclassified Agreia TaxID=2641148 RepID=UPI0006F40E17|nr:MULTISPECIES: hypothetical protein [Microbacteriaceae]KQM60872.1 ATP-dependent DNA ligase [Agreia sp. Leaf210]KQR23986.1 ATP-dependent DNA ligase [Agreia sp. Leaf335]PPF62276.1 ATP-dependent DNA ligase [Clavibacter michiganensis]
MGKLIYGPTGLEIDIDDRVLAHMRVVVNAKFRRGESFLFNWEHNSDEGNGRSSIWMHPTIPLHIRFYGNRQPPVNRAWIEALMVTANSANGMVLIAEPGGTSPQT